MSEQTIDGYVGLDTLMERLPEIDLIQDDELRTDVRDTLNRVTPEYFWHVPASSSGKYHHPSCRGEHGLWIHVKMCITAFERQAQSELQMGRITEYDADVIRASLLLHDVLKYGQSYENDDHTIDTHAKLMATWVRQHSDVPEAVASAIESHSGPAKWGGTEPESVVDMLVHKADMTASDPNVTCGVWKPCDEISDRYPSVPRANL